MSCFGHLGKMALCFSYFGRGIYNDFFSPQKWSNVSYLGSMRVFWRGMTALSFSWLPELGICNLQNKFKIKYPAGQVCTVDLTNWFAIQSFSPSPQLVSLPLFFFPCLHELTAQLFLQAMHLLNCLLMKPFIYLYAWEASCLSCFRFPTRWQAHFIYLSGAYGWWGGWEWLTHSNSNDSDNKTMIRKSSRKQLLHRKTEGTKHCCLQVSSHLFIYLFFFQSFISSVIKLWHDQSNPTCYLFW